FAGRTVRAIQVGLFAGVPVDIRADHQVEPAVAVDIDKGRRRSPAPLSNATLRRDVGEGAVTIIAQQPRLPIPGNEQILGAVVVVIGGCHAHTVEGDGETSALRDILKGAIAPVAVQAHGGLWLLALAGPLAAVDQQDIGPAIPIVIKKSTTSTDGFRVPLLASGAGFMAKDYPGSGRDVAKLDSGQWRCWWCYGNNLRGWLGRLRWLLGVVTRPYQQGQGYYTTHEP